ncbi:hypothetical protein ACFQO4_20540 [Saliphagus sp. GCM10025334]
MTAIKLHPELYPRVINRGCFLVLRDVIVIFVVPPVFVKVHLSVNVVDNEDRSVFLVIALVIQAYSI